MGFARDMIRAVADYNADPKSIVEITATDIGGAISKVGDVGGKVSKSFGKGFEFGKHPITGIKDLAGKIKAGLKGSALLSSISEEGIKKNANEVLQMDVLKIRKTSNRIEVDLKPKATFKNLFKGEAAVGLLVFDYTDANLFLYRVKVSKKPDAAFDTSIEDMDFTDEFSRKKKKTKEPDVAKKDNTPDQLRLVFGDLAAQLKDWTPKKVTGDEVVLDGISDEMIKKDFGDVLQLEVTKINRLVDRITADAKPRYSFKEIFKDKAVSSNIIFDPNAIYLRVYDKDYRKERTAKPIGEFGVKIKSKDFTGKNVDTALKTALKDLLGKVKAWKPGAVAAEPAAKVQKDKQDVGVKIRPYAEKYLFANAVSIDKSDMGGYYVELKPLGNFKNIYKSGNVKDISSMYLVLENKFTRFGVLNKAGEEISFASITSTKMDFKTGEGIEGNIKKVASEFARTDAKSAKSATKAKSAPSITSKPVSPKAKGMLAKAASATKAKKTTKK